MLNQLDTPEALPCRFLVNQALWGIFMNSCLWAAAHQDMLRRIIQNSEVQRIQTVFETLQAQISTLRLCDQGIYGLYEKFGLGRWLVEDIRYFTDEFLSKWCRKCTYLVIRFCVLVESAPNIQMPQEFVKRSHQTFRRKYGVWLTGRLRG